MNNLVDLASTKVEIVVYVAPLPLQEATLDTVAAGSDAHPAGSRQGDDASAAAATTQRPRQLPTRSPEQIRKPSS